MSGMFDRLWAAISGAATVENAHGSTSGDVACAVVSLGCVIARESAIKDGALLILTSNLVVTEPDEKKAIDAVRAAYANNRAAAQFAKVWS